MSTKFSTKKGVCQNCFDIPSLKIHCAYCTKGIKRIEPVKTTITHMTESEYNKKYKTKKCIRCKKKNIDKNDSLGICETCLKYLTNNPSKNNLTSWVFSINNNQRKFKINTARNVGKWMVFLPIKDLDIAWMKVKKATEKSLLGIESKCSTAYDTSMYKNSVIIIYTYDYTDLEDISRVAWEINKLKIGTSIISYKTDKATQENKYIANGDKNISTYTLTSKEFKDKTQAEFYNYFKDKYKQQKTAVILEQENNLLLNKTNKRKLILDIELVPSTSFYNNLRNKISTSEWDRIRKESYAKANNTCSICGASGRLNCHEIWSYDDKKHVQTLKGFIALCNNCHMIKHIGFAGIQADKGMLDMEDLIKHFMKVNKVSRAEYDTHYKESFDIWSERSKHKWKTDLSKWKILIK